MNTKMKSQVICPECGQHFSARGLSGHRRLRHGTAPPAPLPRGARESPESAHAILNALAGLQDAVERIELHLASLGRSAAAPETPAEEALRLERELAQLLRKIVGLKQTGLAATNIRKPASAVEEHASRELARLRRDQARMVFRLEELRTGSASDESFLT